jgi:type IV secretory pathway VirB9-like protein
MENDKQMQEVIMKAENLGSIPPNTALLIITAGKKRYKLHLTSTDKRNAAVRFIYEPPDLNAQRKIQ